LLSQLRLYLSTVEIHRQGGHAGPGTQEPAVGDPPGRLLFHGRRGEETGGGPFWRHTRRYCNHPVRELWARDGGTQSAGKARAEYRCLGEQYPSNFYIWERVARDSGATIRTVPRPLNGDWTNGVLEALDADTAIAALPQCHWSDGSLVDLLRVRHRLDVLGGALVLDLTQSLGAMTFRLDQIRPDFAVAAAYKWLLGPYSTGLLYVDPRHHRGDPLELPIFSRENAEVFSDIRYRSGFAHGACRYDVGEVANFALLPALLNALTQIADWGVPAIESALAQRTERLAHEARGLGLDVTDSRYRAPHFVGIRFPDGPRPALAEQLRAENVYVGLRGDALRVTPHLYNTEADLMRFSEVLRDSL